jgi:hypothetical protein
MFHPKSRHMSLSPHDPSLHGEHPRLESAPEPEPLQSPLLPLPPGPAPPEPRWRHLLGCLSYGFPVVAVLLGIVWGWQLPGTQTPRIVGILLPLGVGLMGGLGAARRSRPLVRLGWLLGGMALAAVNWEFVPTGSGLSRWTAGARLHAVETADVRLSPDDFEALYREGKRAVAEFPQWEPRLEAARKHWTEGRLAASVADARSQAHEDPTGTLARLQELEKTIPTQAHSEALRAELAAGKREAVEAGLASARTELAALVARKDFAAIAPLTQRVAGQWDAVSRAAGAEGALRDFCRDAARARLEPAEQELAALRVDDRNADLAGLLRRVNGEWGKETRDAGAREALAGFGRQVVKARLESADKELGGLAATADWPAMARLAEKVAGGWRDEAEAAGAWQDVDAFCRRAARLCVAAAGKEFQQLRAQQDYAGLERLVEQLRTAWGKEARAAAAEAEVKDFLDRGEAVLDSARAAGRLGPR